MSASVLPLIDFAFTFIEQTRKGYVHPAGATWINGWLCEMRDAAINGDAVAVADLAHRINRKLEQERRWAAESLASARRGISLSGVFTLTLGDDETRRRAPA